MTSLLLSSHRYNAQKNNNYTLSIQLSLDGLSFIIRDYLSNCYVHLQHFPEFNFTKSTSEIKTCITENLLNGIPFKKVFLIIEEPRVSSIPTLYKNEDSIKEFFCLNYAIQNNEKLIFRELSEQNSINVFPVQTDLLDFFNTNFQGITIRHITDIALWNSKSFHNESKQHLAVSIFSNIFYITALNNNELIFNNSFQYSNNDDLLFFLLNTFTKFEFNQYEASISVNGEIERNSHLLKDLQRFVKNVHLEEWPAAFNFTDEFFKIPPYFFTHLFLAPLCES